MAQAALAVGQARARAAEQAGQAQAQAAQQSGQAWGGAIQGIGNIIGGLPKQIQQAKLTDQKLAFGQAQLDDIQGRQAGEKALDSMMSGGQPLREGEEGPQAPSYLTPDGLWDIQKLNGALSQSGFAHAAPGLLKGAEGINDSIAKHQELEQKAAQQHAVLLGDMADTTLKLVKASDGKMSIPDAMDLVVQPALATKRFSPQEYSQVREKLASLPPEQQAAALTSMMDAVSNVGGETLADGAQRRDRFGRLQAENPKDVKPLNPTEASLAADAATIGTPNETPTAKQSAIALDRLKPPKTAGETAAAEQAKYIDIQARIAQKQPVSGGELAWAGGYEKAKTLGPEATAAAAASRQALTQAEQNSLQEKAQAFQVAQVGRHELTEKVEQPYQTALASAQTLRDAVAAARNGNKVAASLQSLETTMAAIRAQGLNRINTAEIGVTANAGDIWDRMAGRLGALSSGQPIPPDIQKDMEQFAGILEKAAYKKYSDAFDSTTTRYKLGDEKKLPSPASSSGGGVKVLSITPKS